MSPAFDKTVQHGGGAQGVQLSHGQANPHLGAAQSVGQPQESADLHDALPGEGIGGAEGPTIACCLEGEPPETAVRAGEILIP
jgi:hypothetical protein